MLNTEDPLGMVFNLITQTLTSELVWESEFRAGEFERAVLARLDGYREALSALPEAERMRRASDLVADLVKTWSKELVYKAKYDDHTLRLFRRVDDGGTVYHRACLEMWDPAGRLVINFPQSAALDDLFRVVEGMASGQDEPGHYPSRTRSRNG
jgi:hypothetical protein